jgi:hypothetical protein
MTPLVPERNLLFSPALAATIGLEEAILLHLLHDLASSSADTRARWHEADHSVLARLLPFWSSPDIQRIARSLADKGVFDLDRASLNGPRLRFSFHSEAPPRAPSAAAPAYEPRRAEPAPAATRAHDHTRAFGAPVRGATRLAADWMPGEDLLQLLALNHGITRQFALSQLEDFILYWRERNEVDHAWSSKFRAHVLRQWRHAQQQTHAQPRTQAPQQGWYPSDDALQILERSGVSRAFIEDAIPEFVLYWRERGEANGTWNSKFIAHIRRQWASYTHALEHEREPHPIPSSWRPNEDVYDILRMANIDAHFADQQLPEFILFWRDAGTAHRSWNTKFLQHVKYQWASRHHLATGKTGVASSSTFDQLTDRSWADGLIAGS